MNVKPRPMSNQEAFNNVWQHFIVERNPRCIGDSGMCLYRSYDNTNGCAIGCQLPDELVPPINGGYMSVLLGCPQLRDYFRFVIRECGDDLQLCHDQANSLEEMETNLRRMAEHWGLTIPAFLSDT